MVHLHNMVLLSCLFSSWWFKERPATFKDFCFLSVAIIIIIIILYQEDLKFRELLTVK